MLENVNLLTFIFFFTIIVFKYLCLKKRFSYAVILSK